VPVTKKGNVGRFAKGIARIAEVVSKENFKIGRTALGQYSVNVSQD
jgi:hypothetical protein